MTRSTVRVLGAGDAPLWVDGFDAVDDAEAASEERARAEVVLALPLLRPHLRVVVLDDAGPLARVAAMHQPERSLLLIGTPRPAAGAEGRVHPEALEDALQAVLAVAAEAGISDAEAAVLADAALRRPWEQALARAGFQVTSDAAEWTRPLDDPVPPVDEDIRVTAWSTLPETTLHELVAAVRSDTADRLDAANPRSPAEIVDDLRSELSGAEEDDLWLVAVDDDRPVGYVLCAVQDDEDEPEAWVIDIGVAPSYRRRGVGALLLRALLERVRERGAAVRAVALIDEVNEPSKRAHIATGFVKTERGKALWRRTS